MKDKIRDFRDLRVWQNAMTLVTQVYEALRQFPANENYGLAAQLRRSVVSVPSNIAEGYRRESTREYLHHLSIAQGSLAEVETQIELALRLNYLTRAGVEQLVSQCQSVGKQLFALRNSLLPKLQPRLPTPGS